MSIIIANSPLKAIYDELFHHIYITKNFNLHMIINDFLMAIFFLYVGLEIKKEMIYGALSSFRKASFPIIASLGGVIVPAIIFMLFNVNTIYKSGVGVAISTDIAFAIGIFMIFKSRLNPHLKIFLLSLAVVDDLISILAIIFLYSSNLNYEALFISTVIFLILLSLNRVFKVKNISVYLLIGLGLWYFVYISGVHATVSGVLLAMTIPSVRKNNEDSVSDKLEHKLSPLCNLIVLPLFAFANTSIVFSFNLDIPNSYNLIMGIVCGLVIGKPLGVVLFSYIATKLQIAEKPSNASWKSIIEVAMLTGIGFTMSIFVSELAFTHIEEAINIAKISILISAVLSITLTHRFLILGPSIPRIRIKKFAK